MITKLSIYCLILLSVAFAFPAQASFTFAPPRESGHKSQPSDIDPNTVVQLSAISSLEKKISTSLSPWMKKQATSLDLTRKDMAKQYKSKLADSTPKTFNYYLFSVLEFIFSNGYILYGILSAILLLIVRVILLRLNFIN